MRAWFHAPWTVVLTLVAAGCGAGLTEAGANVRVVTDAPQDCKRLGAVQGSAAGGHDVERNRQMAQEEIRNSAAEMGGNAVMIDNEEEGKNKLIRLSGVAYQCPGGS
jgi:hypothetical protein